MMDYIIFPKRKELNMELAVTFQKRKELNMGLVVTFHKRCFFFRKFLMADISNYGPTITKKSNFDG